MFRRQSKKWSQVTSKWRGRCTLWPGHRVRISSRRRVLAVSGSCFGFQRISISIFYSKPQSENSHFSHRFLITLFTYSPRFFFRSSRISNTKHSLFFFKSDVLSTRLRVVAIINDADSNLIGWWTKVRRLINQPPKCPWHTWRKWIFLVGDRVDCWISPMV